MNAIVLAAGLGSRLRPYTDTMPKALVPVAGKPMLEHLLLKLKDEGFTNIVVNIHYLGEQIVDFLKARQNFGLHITISDERGFLLDTGGGIRRASAYFCDGSPVLVHNVDVFSNICLRELMQQAVNENDDALLVVSRRDSSRMLYFDEGLRLKGWQNLKTGETKPVDEEFSPQTCTPLAFDGIHVMSAPLLSLMQRDFDGAFPLIPFYLSAAKTSLIKGFLPPADFRWVDAGKPQALDEAASIVAL